RAGREVPRLPPHLFARDDSSGGQKVSDINGEKTSGTIEPRTALKTQQKHYEFSYAYRVPGQVHSGASRAPGGRYSGVLAPTRLFNRCVGGTDQPDLRQRLCGEIEPSLSIASSVGRRTQKLIRQSAIPIQAPYRGATLESHRCGGAGGSTGSLVWCCHSEQQRPYH